MLSIGRALAPLRSEHILFVGTGGIVHNLSRAQMDNESAAPEAWAVEFDTWVREKAGELDAAALGDYLRLAPRA